jgi:hypothetical protein
MAKAMRSTLGTKPAPPSGMRYLGPAFSLLLFAACERAAKPTDDSGSGRVEMVATPSNIGWMLYFPLPQSATKPEYRLGTDAQTHPLIDNMVTVPMSREPITIHVSWVDADGQRGPFTHTFEPRSALADSAMRHLEQSPPGWVELRDMDGPGPKLLYVTSLVSERCGIEKMVYGVDTMEPTLEIELGECNVMDPYSIEYDAVTHVELPSDAQFVSIQLTYFDGRTSPVQRFDWFKTY